MLTSVYKAQAEWCPEMKSNYTIHIANAFTSDKKATLGNPAGTVFLEELLSCERMSQIAEKAGQPITAFLVPKNSSNTEYILRYYDLTGRECHICGHATVASTAQLVSKHPDLEGKSITFYLNPDQFNGEEVTLTTHIKDSNISIDLPASTLRHEEHNPQLMEAICKGLNVNPEDIYSIAFSVDVRDYVVGLKSQKTLINLKPDFEFLKQMAEAGEFQHEGMMVTSPADEQSEFDINVRVFLPITGVNEDIACGSGNCSIIPYWYQRGYWGQKQQFHSVFPFPEGKKGYLGGIQHVAYDVEKGRIQIISQATLQPSISVAVNEYEGFMENVSNKKPHNTTYSNLVT